MRPGLTPLARFRMEVGPVHELGSTHGGHRRIINVVGGSFEGARLSGEVLPGGADWQIVHPDGSASIDARHTLRTHDGALIYLQAAGLRHGPARVMDRLGRGEAVDLAEYYFRLLCRFETGAAEYDWLNRCLAVAAGERTPDAVRYHAYEVT